MRRGPAATTPFVGREREIEVLGSCLDDARAGDGRVALLTGEPGIGKTRTTLELARRAADSDIRVLTGSCHERPVPYEPWVEALDPVASTMPIRVLRKVVEDAPATASVLPAARARLPELPELPGLDAEDARIRALDAVLRFLLQLAEEPTLLVLDDLHWADAQSLDVLADLSRDLASAHLLVLGAYRDEGLTLAHPLSRALAEMDRQRRCERIHLGGLDQEQSTVLIDALYGGPVAAPLAELIRRETEGNPFFLGEVVRHLRDEGQDLTASAALDTIGLPDTIRQAVGARVVRLTPESGRILELAAAFHGRFEFSLLHTLSGLQEGRALDALDEALAAGLLRSAGGEEYQFTHALVRQTLYDELSPSRRARLHRRIAQALEELHDGREVDYAAELAYQYSRSATLPGSAHGLRYALAAAEAAQAALARDQAVTFLEMALELSTETDRSVRGDVLCRLALAEADALRLDEARQRAETALELLDDEAGAAFLGDFCWALKDAGAPGKDVAPLIERGLVLAGERQDLTWARLVLACIPVEERRQGGLRYGIWRGLDPEAMSIERATGDEGEYARTLEPLDQRTRAETDDLLEIVRGWTNAVPKIHGLSVVARILIYRHGALREGAEVSAELLALSEEVGSLSGQAFGLAILAETEAAFGDFRASRETATRAQGLITRLGGGHRLRRWRTGAGLLVSYVGGEWAAIAGSYSELASGQEAGWPWMSLVVAGAALAHVRAGAQSEAEALLGDLTRAIEEQESAVPGQSEAVGEAASAVWELELVSLAVRYRALALALLEADIGDTPGSCRELTVARMATLLGEEDQAAAYFDRARSALDASGQRPLRAIVDYDEARARVRGRQAGAQPLLDAARAGFDELEMTYWLGRAGELADVVASNRHLAYPAGLTDREVEILGLVAAGLANKEIARRLFLSVHTVTRHVANVYAKIDAHNRAEATAFALRHGLAAPRSNT